MLGSYKIWTGLSLVLCVGLGAAADSTCYWPDGSIASDNIPCDPTAEVTSCCPNDGRSVCLSNGLCFFLPDGTIDRFSCTDQGWGEGCSDRCIAKDSIYYPLNGHADLFQCMQDAKYCCGADTTCCTNGDGFFLANSNITGPPSLIKSLTPNTTDADSANRTTTITTTTVSSSTSSSAREAAIGAGVGGPLGIALIGALFLLWRERRARRREMANVRYSGAYAGIPADASPSAYPRSSTTYIPRSDARDSAFEVSSQNIVELDNGRVPERKP
ncbi:MAG: hypothetical protein M1825_000248 [Sarcosagium campestre]|nr:MAG: hypothetical protein M1825_000248 [Sarcosagium campestre]